jgi:hypothetical protein
MITFTEIHNLSNYIGLERCGLINFRQYRVQNSVQKLQTLTNVA